MKWTFVIATWQRAELLRATLRSLELQTEQDFEVVVVSDGDDVATRSLSENYIAPFSLLWIFHDSNRGLAAARNTGAYSAIGEMLLFLDDDVIASPELLRIHDDKHSGALDWPVCIVFGRIVEERQVPTVSKTDEFLQEEWEQYLEKYQPLDRMPDTVSVGSQAESSVCCGLNCSIRRTLFVEIGGFDQVLRTGQDMELGLRLYRRGVQFRYAHEAVVRHRDTKIMSTYSPRCSHLNGGLDVYRARELGQRSAQNSQLTIMRHGTLPWRTFVRGAFRKPNVYRRAARVMEHITDRSHARLSFRIWSCLRHAAEYWSGVRETGITEDELYLLAAAPRRVLLFRGISTPRNSKEASYYTSPDRFRRHLVWIRKLGYRFEDPDGWLGDDLGNERGVWLTFDDACDDLYASVLPACLEFGIKVLVFADQIGKSNHSNQAYGLRTRSPLRLVHMREMQKHGFSFGAHSTTHKRLITMANAELRREVRDSKSRLEDVLGQRVNWFAYPFGEVDRRVRAAVAEAGFRLAVTAQPGLNHWEDPLALKRIEIRECDTMLDFMLKLQTGRNGRDIRRGVVRRIRRVMTR